MKHQFLTYREEDETGLLCYYIAQKNFPYYVAIVSVGQIPESLASAPVGNYNLYVNFHSVLSGNYIPNYKDVLVEISACMWDMANWFCANRVEKQPNKYSKFKIQNT